MILIPIAITAAVAYALVRTRTGSTLSGTIPIPGGGGITPRPSGNGGTKPAPAADTFPKGTIAIVSVEGDNFPLADLATAAGGAAGLATISAVAIRADEVTPTTFAGPVVALLKTNGSFARPEASVKLASYRNIVAQQYAPGTSLV